MNIYLDIDGVIVGTASPQRDIFKLLKYIVKHYPNSTYWLTTHCKGGINRSIEWLRQNDFPDDLINEMEGLIKPTDWETMKTEAINLDQDFIWFDDSLFESEKQILEAYHVLDGFYQMDPRDPKAAKNALKFLKSIRK